MEIKCPKCRFRYDEQIAPGIKEASCVCPRCGTPFIFKTGETDDTEDRQPTSAEQAPATGTATTATTVEPPTPGGHHTDADEAAHATPGSDSHDSHHAHRQPLIPSQHAIKHSLEKKTPADWKNLRRRIVIIAAILFVATATINNCVRHNSHNNAAEEERIVQTNADTSTSMHDGAKTIGDEYKWIEGGWRSTADDLDLSFSIRGSQISVTDGGDRISGTYVIKGKHIEYNNYSFRMDKKHHCFWHAGVKFVQADEF